MFVTLSNVYHQKCSGENDLRFMGGTKSAPTKDFNERSFVGAAHEPPGKPNGFNRIKKLCANVFITLSNVYHQKCSGENDLRFMGGTKSAPTKDFNERSFVGAIHESPTTLTLFLDNR